MRAVAAWLIVIVFMEAGLVGGALLLGEWGILIGQVIGGIVGLVLAALIYSLGD